MTTQTKTIKPNTIPSNEPLLQDVAKKAVENKELLTLIKRTLYMKDFPEFVKEAWDIIEPGVPYSHNWHIELLAEELIAMFIDNLAHIYPDVDVSQVKKKSKNRLCVNIPTRSMKTLLISVFFPCWLIIHMPSIKIMTISYSDDLSRQINRQRRDIINSEWYQKYFGDIVKIKEGMDRQDMFETEALGLMFSTSVRGTVTGYGADLIILDDVQKPMDMWSETERNRAILFMKETLPTRLNNRRTGKIINVQQRLHYSDLTGYILENMPSTYTHIKIPLIAEENESWVGKISGQKWKRKRGTVLWPDRMDLEQAETLRVELGSLAFDAQQQQDPTPEGGHIIDVNWFTYYGFTPEELIKHFKENDPETFNGLSIVMSWDMTFKKSKDTDFVGCIVGLHDMKTDETYIIDYVKERMTFTETLSRVMGVRDRWDGIGIPITVIVEEKANGSAVLDVLSQRVAGFLPFDPGNQDKITRMKLVVPYVESKKIKLPELNKASWVASFVSDMARFPYIEHDDIPDAFSQLMVRTYVRRKNKKTYYIF